MRKEDIDSYRKQLLEKFGEEELEEKIGKKQEEFLGLVNKETAVYIIAKEQGIIKENRVSSIKEGEKNVSLKGKVERIYPVGEFERNGRKGKIGSCLLSDGIKTTRVVFWDEKTEELKKIKIGDIIKIERGHVKDGEIHTRRDSRIIINPKC